MNKLDEDFDDSSLFCKSLIQKHKTFKNINSQQPKQLKLTFHQSSNDKKKQSNECEQVENLSEGIVKSTKNNGWNLNESKSSYFNSKQLTNICPLCIRPFNNDLAYSVHMKQCAKTHKLTTQELLEALELQKKQMQERRDLELHSRIITAPKRGTSKKNVKNNKESFDLALGLALSRSLVTCKTKAGCPSEEVQKATLEEFGFKRNTLATSRKRRDNEKKPVLKDRTMEERQKIIVEKVAMILLDEDEERDFEKKKLNKNAFSQNNKVPYLWGLAENYGSCDWCTTGIQPLISLEKKNAGEEETKSILSDNIESVILKLNLPREEIYIGWKKMINNCIKSDLAGKTKDSQDVYFHSLVLFARCPEVLEKDFESIIQKYNFSTIIILFEYLYCGTLNGLIRSEINNLYDLAIELNFGELISTLNQLKSNLFDEECDEISNSPKLKNVENNALTSEVIENEKPETVRKHCMQEKDLFIEDLVDLTQSSPRYVDEVNESSSENESNIEKSYWSFIRHEKRKEKNSLDMDIKRTQTNENQRNDLLPILNDYVEKEKEIENNVINATETNEVTEPQKMLSDDSMTQDVIDEFRNRDAKLNSTDCVIISSGSESKTEENSFKLERENSKDSLLVGRDYEVPYFDPYDNFHYFSEEQFSPVGLHSQSLLMDDISGGSLKLLDSTQKNIRHLNDSFHEDPQKTVGYCSTPVTVRQVSKINYTNENSTIRKNKRKRNDLSASRILRKSLKLQHKLKNPKESSLKKSNVQRGRRGCKTKQFAKALTDTIINELSRSSLFNSSPLRTKKFIEITPINNREEFGETVTPSPNYSNMGESMLKEQLTKYGLKRNLAKSKAKKILRYIYEELHPLYNTETKKFVKVLPTASSKAGKKLKPDGSCNKNAKAAQKKNGASVKNKSGKKTKDHLNYSGESAVFTDTTVISPDGPVHQYSDGSEFDYLSETLTQSIPTNPVDLPSVFCELVQSDPEYHEKILLYEPIWLEELQKKLKEAFKKHFKLTDLMDFLDQKCITFRSEAQARRLHRRNEMKKENLKKIKKPSS